MFKFSPQIHMLKSNLQVMAFGNGAFWRVIGSESRAVINGINPYNRDPKELALFIPFRHVRAQQQGGI